MKKYPFMKFYPADWLNDTRKLSPEAKACWIDMICLMWNSPKRGVWSGTYEEFARVTGIPWEIAPRVINELGHEASRVTLRDKIVTLECRRIVNLDSHYKSNANRQHRFRVLHKSNAIVTRKKSEVRSQKSELTTTPLAANAALLGSASPPLNDNGRLVRHYKSLKGFLVDDKEWDKKFWGRSAKAAFDVLQAIGGADNAISFMNYWAKEYDNRGLEWTFETLAKKAVEWKSKERAKYADRTIGGISLDNTQRRAEGAHSGDLVKASPGSVLDALRNETNAVPRDRPGNQRSPAGFHV